VYLIVLGVMLSARGEEKREPKKVERENADRMETKVHNSSSLYPMKHGDATP
jgi:hypothetical protein